MRFLMAKEALSEADRELVWEAGVMQDGEMQIELLKTLIGAAADMQSRDREFCLDKLEPTVHIHMRSRARRPGTAPSVTHTHMRSRAGRRGNVRNTRN